MTIWLVSALIWFLTFEETAIATVPRQDVVIYAPQVTPQAGDAGVGAALWPTLRCARCHGDDARGGPNAPAVLGTDLTFDDFYLRVRQGSEKMPSFGPEELPDGYLLHLWTWLTSAPTP
jgi:mono/diheme cytochrome c family protein